MLIANAAFRQISQSASPSFRHISSRAGMTLNVIKEAFTSVCMTIIMEAIKRAVPIFDIDKSLI